jgi:tetratricopeptide (TPR) repeat protein
MANYAEAIKDFNKAIELNPEDANAYFNRGGAYRDTGNYGQAVKDFTRAIELSPKDADAYDNRGIAYDLKGEYAQALKDYNRSIELNPESAILTTIVGGLTTIKATISKPSETTTKLLS